MEKTFLGPRFLYSTYFTTYVGFAVESGRSASSAKGARSAGQKQVEKAANAGCSQVADPMQVQSESGEFPFAFYIAKSLLQTCLDPDFHCFLYIMAEGQGGEQIYYSGYESPSLWPSGFPFFTFVARHLQDISARPK